MDIIFCSESDGMACISIGTPLQTPAGIRYNLFFHGLDPDQLINHFLSHLLNLLTSLKADTDIYIFSRYDAAIPDAGFRSNLKAYFGDVFVGNDVKSTYVLLGKIYSKFKSNL